MTRNLSISDRAVGAYLGVAVGDALGATVEFMLPREIVAQYGVHRDIVGGGWLKLRRGQVTDDTEMSLVLGRSILRHRRLEPEAIAFAFSEWASGKPVDIGHTIYRGIVRYRRTGETAVPENEYDAGNGACMRCLPVALATYGAAELAVRRAVRLQSHITHNSPLSDSGTLGVVQLVQHCLMHDGDYAAFHTALRGFVDLHPRFRFDKRRVVNPGGFIVETLRAVFQALNDTDNFEDALVDVVNRGGDADTTGAICGMIAGAIYGPRSIPARWLQRLDPAVRRECEDQARELIALAATAQRPRRGVTADP